MDGLFSSLKAEQTARKVNHTDDDARADVFDDIKRFYNPRWRHSKLGLKRGQVLDHTVPGPAAAQ